MSVPPVRHEPQAPQARLALLAATLLELRAVLRPLLAGRSQALAMLEVLEEGRVAQLGLAPGHPLGAVLVLATGIGPLNAALGLGRLQGSQTLCGVLNLGVAGSFDTAALPVGQVVAVERECWPEFGLHTAAGLDPAGLGFAQAQGPGGPVHADIALDPGAAALAMGLPPRLVEALPRAPALTVAGVSGWSGRAGELAARHGPGPLLENMEGFALALGCLRAGLPFMELRSVSNRVGQRPPHGWNLPLALETLGSVALEILGESEYLLLT